MLELAEKIRRYRKQYWETGTSDISDSEYDELLIKLESVCPDHELLQDIEHAEIDPSKKYKHPAKLYSLNKVFSTEELGEWMVKVARGPDEAFSITPKYDGMAARYYSKDKVLITRGDGEWGENITHMMPIINIARLKHINYHGEDIDGELLVKKSELKATTLTRSDGNKYKTERNAVCGITNNDQVQPFIGKITLTLQEYTSMEYVRTFTDFANDWEAIVNEFKNGDFPLDGVVIKLQDDDYRESLGYTSKFPKGAVAYKFQDEVKETTLVDVIFQSGKNKITPVAVLDPIVLDGATVTRATLHNVKFCLDKDLHIGDTVQIKRSGSVIPKIVGSKPGADRKSISIHACPACGGPIEYAEPDIKCMSSDCAGSNKKKIRQSATILGLTDIGAGTIDKIVDKYDAKTIIDILTLEYDEILALDGFAETSAQNAYNAIQNVLNGTHLDFKIMACLSIPGIGRTIWKDILSKYYLKDIVEFSVDDFVTLDGISYDRAQLISDGIDNNEEILSSFFDILNIENTKDVLTELPKICFSGNFPHPKATYSQIAKRKGFEVVNSVTKKLKYLVNNGATTSKVSKAKQYGVRVITEQEFLNL